MHVAANGPEFQQIIRVFRSVFRPVGDLGDDPEAFDFYPLAPFAPLWPVSAFAAG